MMVSVVELRSQDPRMPARPHCSSRSLVLHCRRALAGCCHYHHEVLVESPQMILDHHRCQSLSLSSADLAGSHPWHDWDCKPIKRKRQRRTRVVWHLNSSRRELVTFDSRLARNCVCPYRKRIIIWLTEWLASRMNLLVSISAETWNGRHQAVWAVERAPLS